MKRDETTTFAWNKDGGVPPWRGLGSEIKAGSSVKQVLKAANLDWEVEKRPVFRKVGNKFEPVPNKFELTRTDSDLHLSLIGAGYRPTQNERSMGLFQEFIDQGRMQLVAAGSYANSKYIWALARVKDGEFTVGPKKADDRMESYILMSSPHVLGKALIFQYANRRFSCWNMMTYSLGTSIKGGKTAIRFPHSMDFDDLARADAAEAVSFAIEQAKQFKEAANVLAKSKAETDQVDAYFKELLKFNPETSTKARKLDGAVRVPRLLPKFHDALLHAPGQQIDSAKGTWWGAFNAVTAVLDHNHGRDRGTALRGAWIGGPARMKRRALELALVRAA